MAMFSKESLQNLKEKIDLVEVISSYLPLKKAGKSFKICCPFHNEKTPSFVINPGDTHYHCFGCGAHGDAISFLVGFLKVSFGEAVDMLAEKFGVTLHYQEGEKKEDLGPLRHVLDECSKFFQFHLLHTEEGRAALDYLYQRGIDLDFIHLFKVGLAPKDPLLSLKVFKEKKLPFEALQRAGLLLENKKNFPFFVERITFPIMDVQGNVIGFSARKFSEKTIGGKYINTKETPLFKKSKILFGLNYSRKEITRQRRAVIVEGQIDALRLIQEGLNLTVAGQGTAFGEEHVEVIRRLGVKEVFLGFDGDDAGREAALKVGNFFQKEGVEVFVLEFKDGEDPDSVLRKEGITGFLNYLHKPKEYIPFLVEMLSKSSNIATPAGKNELVEKAKKLLAEWKFPLMVYEAERRLASLLQVPEEMVQQKIHLVKEPKKDFLVNPDLVLEADLLRWIVVTSSSEETLFPIIQKNLTPIDFIDPSARKLYIHLCELFSEKREVDLLTLAEYIDREEEELLNLIVKKKIQVERAKIGVRESIQKILERNWMLRRESIKTKIQMGKHSEVEILELAKEFDELKKMTPKLVDIEV
ncbi:MAG: DNA primase [Chlamydiae bacterium]|nr:DNA primase [Chlamydiota bacterium]